MSVDWFTVAAQIVNFLILVWLLKRFLYKPVLTAMHNRQQKVEDELEQAATLAKSAENEKKHYLALQEEVQELSKNELRQARQEADDLRKNLFQKIEAEAETARRQWQDELAREKAFFINQASVQISKQFQRLAQTAFRNLVDTDFEEGMVSNFCRLIAQHDSEADFFRQLQNPEELRVRTAFSLSNESKKRLREALWWRLENQPELDFQIDPTLIAGILVSSDDHKLEWNMQQYLDDFQTEMESFFSKNSN